MRALFTAFLPFFRRKHRCFHCRCHSDNVQDLSNGGLLTIWKINTQGKDGQASHHVVRIGMTEDGDRAPWLERLGDRILGMTPPISVSPENWQILAREKKQRLQELLHRELSYSGIINDSMSYAAVPLAFIGMEPFPK